MASLMGIINVCMCMFVCVYVCMYMRVFVCLMPTLGTLSAFLRPALLRIDARVWHIFYFCIMCICKLENMSTMRVCINISLWYNV